MFSTHRLRRPAIVGALTCALLASALGGVAVAQTSEASRLAAARQQERYYASYPALDPHPQGEYYASYGEPEPLTAPQSPAPSDDSPWPTVAIAVAAALAATTLVATQRRRLRFRRRSARATT
jgi:hypothetical protein